MSAKELASSASSNNHPSEQQHPLSDEEQGFQTIPKGEEQEEGKEDPRQLTGMKVQFSPVPASALLLIESSGSSSSPAR